MKNNIYLIPCMIIYMSCFGDSACFAIQDPNRINFEDPFYKEVLKASIPEAYFTESGEIQDYARRSFLDSIIREAILAQQKYSGMLSLWNEPNRLPSDYQEAAVSILNHLELNEKRLLTFGTVIKTLGVPDNVTFNGYHSDEHGTEATFERFCAFYNRKKVDIAFSVMGFCCSVTIDSSIVNEGIRRWPQTYSYADQIPIVCTFEQKSRIDEKLLKAIDSIKSVKSGYWDWVSYMERWPEDHKVPYAKCEISIMLIDHILDNLAIVYLKIAGPKETLYCDTWWKRETDQWILLKDEQVTQYFSQLKNKKKETALFLPIIDSIEGESIVAYYIDRYIEDASLLPNKFSILIAIWPDGTILFSKDTRYGGEPYYRATLSQGEINKLFDFLLAQNLFADPTCKESYCSLHEDIPTLIIVSEDEYIDMRNSHKLWEEKSEGAVVGTSKGLVLKKYSSEDEIESYRTQDYIKFRTNWDLIVEYLYSLIPEQEEEIDEVRIKVKKY